MWIITEFSPLKHFARTNRLSKIDGEDKIVENPWTRERGEKDFRYLAVSHFSLHGCKLHSSHLRNQPIMVFDVIEPRAQNRSAAMSGLANEARLSSREVAISGLIRLRIQSDTIRFPSLRATLGEFRSWNITNRFTFVKKGLKNFVKPPPPPLFTQVPCRPFIVPIYALYNLLSSIWFWNS